MTSMASDDGVGSIQLQEEDVGAFDGAANWFERSLIASVGTTSTESELHVAKTAETQEMDMMVHGYETTQNQCEEWEELLEQYVPMSPADADAALLSSRPLVGETIPGIGRALECHDGELQSLSHSPVPSSQGKVSRYPRKVSYRSAAEPAEMRRAKNRELMRRTRQKERENLERMKQTVAQLEKEYNALVQRVGSTWHQKPSGIVGRGAYEEDPMELVKRLGAEKMYLKAALQDLGVWKRELSRVVDSTPYIDKLSNDTDPAAQPRELEKEEAARIFRFHPVTEEFMKEKILENTREIRKIQNQLENATSEMLRDHLQVLGWDVRRRIMGSQLEFLCTKRFKKLPLHKIMDTTFESDKRLRHFQRYDKDTHRLDVLQYINNDAYVAGRQNSAPDRPNQFRAAFLRFRIETNAEVVNRSDPSGPKLPASGYWIGTHTITPVTFEDELPSMRHDELGRQLHWVGLTFAIELLDVKNPVTGEEYSEIQWTGRTDYTTNFDARRNAMDVLSIVLHWEFLSIGPELTIITSSDS